MSGRLPVVFLLLLWTAPAGAEPDATVTVRLVEGADELAVVLTVPGGSGRPVTVDFGDSPFLEGPASWNRFVEDGGGRVPPWSADPAELSYRVRLTHHQVPHDHGVDEVPHPVEGGWFLVGRAFIPMFPPASGSRPVAISWELPDGWEAAHSLAADPTLAEARETVFYIGQFARREVTVGGARVELVTSGYGERVLEGVAEGLVRTLERAEARLGPIPDRRKLVTLDPPPPDAPMDVFQGGVIGDGVSLLTPAPPTAELGGAGGSLLIHELTHLWIHEGPLWFREGLTQFETVLGQGELAGMSETERIELFQGQDRHHQRVWGKESLRGMRGYGAYTAGAVFGFCVDVELRREGSDLGQVLRGIGYRPTTRPDQDFFRRLRDISPRVARYARRWLGSRRPDDLQACLERAGYEVEVHRYLALSTVDLAEEVLGVDGMRLSRNLVTATPDGSPFEPGDRIVEVEGAGAADAADLIWLLRDAAPESEIGLTALRNGEHIQLSVVMPVIDDSRRTEERRIEITIPEGGAPYSPLGAAELSRAEECESSDK